MGEQMTAIVAEGDRGRLFVSPTDEHIQAAISAEPAWRPTGNLPNRALGFRVQRYGFTQWHQLFTKRQLLAITTFSDLIADVRQMLRQDSGDDEYADAICTYLTLAIGRKADSSCSYAMWANGGEFVVHVFSRQAISMVWDFAGSKYLFCFNPELDGPN